MFLWLWLLAGHGPQRYVWPGPKWEDVWIPDRGASSDPRWGRACWKRNGEVGAELTQAEMDELGRALEKHDAS
jgi:hypothetical protein